MFNKLYIYIDIYIYILNWSLAMLNTFWKKPKHTLQEPPKKTSNSGCKGGVMGV